MNKTFFDIYNAVSPATPIFDWSADEQSRIESLVNAGFENVDGLLMKMKLWPSDWSDEDKAKISTELGMPA